ncbi:MAG TPA: PAC2 family protein [Dehalococcoidia bacterium]|nr:PAC2 family protein [Dehalococcoidia bacterium]
MRVGQFEMTEPLPELNSPRLLATLQPWVDVGSVGTLTIAYLEELWHGKELGRLARPGYFFDFTRYRPLVGIREGRQRHVSLPNTVVQHVHRNGEDWLFLHGLEPHANGEEYVESLVELMETLKVSEYLVIGSMYGPVPHSRPIVPVGGAPDGDLSERLQSLGVRVSNYEGPTSIVSMAAELAEAKGIRTGIVLMQLPAYAQLEQDTRGQHAALDLLRRLYDWGDLDLESIRLQGERQYSAIDETAQQDPRLRKWLQELETVYDAELANGSGETSSEALQLSEETERFLKEIESRWEHPEGE